MHLLFTYCKQANDPHYYNYMQTNLIVQPTELLVFVTYNTKGRLVNLDYFDVSGGVEEL